MTPALRSKSGSRGKSQLRYVHGRRASSRSQRQTLVRLIEVTISRRTASRAMSAMDRRASGRPALRGRSQARALISTTTRGGKGPRPAGPRAIVETRRAILEEPLAPAAHGRAHRAQPLGDLVVAQPVGREHDDLGGCTRCSPFAVLTAGQDRRDQSGPRACPHWARLRNWNPVAAKQSSCRER